MNDEQNQNSGNSHALSTPKLAVVLYLVSPSVMLPGNATKKLRPENIRQHHAMKLAKRAPYSTYRSSSLSLQSGLVICEMVEVMGKRHRGICHASWPEYAGKRVSDDSCELGDITGDDLKPPEGRANGIQGTVTCVFCVRGALLWKQIEHYQRESPKRSRY